MPVHLSKIYCFILLEKELSQTVQCVYIYIYIDGERERGVDLLEHAPEMVGNFEKVDEMQCDFVPEKNMVDASLILWIR